MNAAKNEDKLQGLKDFDDALFKHLAFQFKTLGRAIARAWTQGRFTDSPIKGPIAPYYRAANQFSAAFALVSEAAMLSLGGALKRREMLSARLGDILSELFLLSAVLKRFDDDGRPHADLPLVHWACQTCLHRVDTSLAEILHNFPNRFLAWVLGWMVRPFGERHRRAADRLTRECAELLLEPSPTRDRLTDGIFAADQSSGIGQLEHALELTLAVEPARRKMRKAKVSDIEAALARNIITEHEAEQLHEARAAVREILKVDDFAPEEITGKPSRSVEAEGAKTSQPARAKPKRARERASQSTS